MSTTLKRSLGLTDAVTIGVGSMLGAGIFAALGPATAKAGTAIYIALALAAVVAFCNAAASGQLAAQHPVAGGTYAYGRAQLGPAWGLAAGWGFLLGKTASAAAMALTVAAYALPGAPTWAHKLAAVAALIALTTINVLGVSKTARVTTIIVTLVLLGLVAFVATTWIFSPSAEVASPSPFPLTTAGGWLGVLQGAGILFFAFAGYARIATLGEEVREPRTTIPRAIMVALAITLVIYLIITFTVTHALGSETLAASTAPLLDAVAVGWMAPVMQVAATLACLGALLGLMAGLGRTSWAMARDSRRYTFFAHVNASHSTPARAEILFCVLAIGLVIAVDIRQAVGFSSTGVLLYYAIANLAAFTQTGEYRMYPRALNVLGVVLCVLIGFTVSPIGLGLGAIAAVIITAVNFLARAR